MAFAAGSLNSVPHTSAVTARALTNSFISHFLRKSQKCVAASSGFIYLPCPCLRHLRSSRPFRSQLLGIVQQAVNRVHPLGIPAVPVRQEPASNVRGILP